MKNLKEGNNLECQRPHKDLTRLWSLNTINGNFYLNIFIVIKEYIYAKRRESTTRKFKLCTFWAPYENSCYVSAYSRKSEIVNLILLRCEVLFDENIRDFILNLELNGHECCQIWYHIW